MVKQCSFFLSCFSCFGKFAESEVLEDGIGELPEFGVVNLSWGLGVDSFSGFLNPGPLFSSDGVVLRFSEFLKSSLDLIIGEGSIMVGIEMFEGLLGELFGDTSFSSSSLITMFSLVLSSLFLSNFAESEVFEEGIGEMEEFFVVNFTWGLGVDLGSFSLNPFPLISSDGVVHGFSEVLNSNFDLIIGESLVVIGIEMFESSLGLSPGDALCSCLFSSGFLGIMAESEMFEEGIGESVEFFLVNFTWGGRVDLGSFSLNPFPLISSDGVVKRFSEFLKSNLDLIIGEGSIMVGIKLLETFFGLFPGKASSFSFN
jgi:hypothetical protein